jgi:hypothetical protein
MKMCAFKKMTTEMTASESTRSVNGSLAADAVVAIPENERW